MFRFWQPALNVMLSLVVVVSVVGIVRLVVVLLLMVVEFVVFAFVIWLMFPPNNHFFVETVY